MRKLFVAAAAVLGFFALSAQAVEINVTQMDFYSAAPGPQAPGFTDPGATGTVNSDVTGVLNSGTPFFGVPWVATQQVWFDTPGAHTWSGTVPDTGQTTPAPGTPFSYTFTLGANQFASGLFFNWSGNDNIPVLAVFDCAPGTAGSACSAVDTDGDGNPGTAMVTAPFPGQTPSFSGTLTIAPNQLPVANGDTASTTVDVAIPALDIVANDTDPEDGSPPPVPPASVNLASGTTTQGGSVSDNGDGTVNYTPPAGVSGVTDTFQYTLTDSDGGVSNSATVSITITVVANTPPVANDLNVTTDEDTDLLTFPISNDTDADSDPLSIFSFDINSVAGGTVVDSGNNSLTYTPPANFFGSDSFGYVVTDGNGGTDSATVFITVSPVNDAPVCADVDLNTSLDTPVDIGVAADLLSTCSDVEGDTLALDSTTQPNQGGILTFDGADTLTYTPASGFIGADRFTYTVTDGAATDTRNVTVTVGKIFGNFTMIDAAGGTFGGTNDIVATWDTTLNTDVSSTNFNMTIKSDSDHPFFGKVWSAHNIRVFGPGSYSFDTTCTVSELESGIADCGGTADELLHLTVGADQIGAHVLFDWSGNANIDVVLLWDQNGSFQTAAPGALYQGDAGPTPALDAIFELVSRDADGDGIAGAKMIDGPFIDFRANFNLNFTQSSGGGEFVVPVSSISSPNLGSATSGCTIGGTNDLLNQSEWLILSGFIALLGISTSRRRRCKPH
jgi:hypothetical protein